MTNKLVTFNIDDQMYSKFKKNTDGENYSHVIEDFMKSVIDEKAKENLIAPVQIMEKSRMTNDWHERRDKGENSLNNGARTYTL